MDETTATPTPAPVVVRKSGDPAGAIEDLPETQFKVVQIISETWTEVSEGKPRLLVLLEDGRQAWLYQSGALIGTDRRGISPPKSSEYRERAKEARRVRAANAARNALIRTGVIKGDNANVYDIWGEIVARQAELAMDVTARQASTLAARFVGQAAELFEPEIRRSDSGGRGVDGGIELRVTGQAALEALQLMRRGAQNTIIDADTV